MTFDILNGFLETEIKNVNSPEHPEMYTAIVAFLTSYEIREGVFEANEYILQKLDRETVLIFQEYETD